MCKNILKIILLIYIFIFPIYTNASDDITRGEFAKYVSSLIGSSEYNYNNNFIDVSAEDDFSSAVGLLSEFSIMQGDNNYFRPYDYITNEEAAVVFIKIWEIRCGEIEGAAMAAFYKDYFDISPWARQYVNKAAMINATFNYNDSNYFYPQGYLTKEAAYKNTANLTNSINVMKKVNIDVISSFRINADTIYSVDKGNKVDCFLTLNNLNTVDFNDVTVITTLYEKTSTGREMLSDINIKEYKNIKADDFIIMHGEVYVPTYSKCYKIKAFFWNNLGYMKPVFEKAILD